MNNLIKIFDHDKANQLAELGFEYIYDSINNERVYAFFVSKELMEHLHNNFDAKDFLINNVLHF